MAVKRREGDGAGKEEETTEERREHGHLCNDFNESAESPADTLDMAPGD